MLMLPFDWVAISIYNIYKDFSGFNTYEWTSTKLQYPVFVKYNLKVFLDRRTSCMFPRIEDTNSLPPTSLLIRICKIQGILFTCLIGTELTCNFWK